MSFLTDLVDPGVRAWFAAGALIAFVAGFYGIVALRMWSDHQRGSGLLILTALVLAGVGVAGLIGVRAGIVPALVALVLYWILMRIGSWLMKRLRARRRARQR